MTKTAKEYHNETSYKRNMLGSHQLDWQNQPSLFKEYEGLKEISLPESKIPSNISIKSIQDLKTPESGTDQFDINTISTILRLTYCITAESKFSRGTYYYRSAASAGALYPVEIYVMIRDIDGLDDGVYHFNIINYSLTRLRKGDFSDYAGSITFPIQKNRPAISFILSSIFFRSSWKYRDRAYRYNLLDTGHVLENLILALNSLSMSSNTFYDFDDIKINRLLGIDEFREATLAIINVPGKENMKDDINASIDALPDETLNASIVSGNDLDYPAIREIHTAGNIPPLREVLNKESSDISFSAGSWMNIETSDKPEKGISYPECLFLRRSKRNFVDMKMDQNDFMETLDIVSGKSGANINEPYQEILNIAFFAEKIENIAQGLYTLDRAQRRFGIIQEGAFGQRIAHTCLNQEWLKNTSLHFLITCNIEELDKAYGPRGYRYAMINAGRIGQLLYITATSLGLGCCGIGAFYDDEAMDLIGLEKGSRLLYLVAVGKVKS